MFDPVRPYCDPFRSLVGVVRNCFLSKWVAVTPVFFCIFFEGEESKDWNLFLFFAPRFFFSCAAEAAMLQLSALDRLGSQTRAAGKATKGHPISSTNLHIIAAAA